MDASKNEKSFDNRCAALVSRKGRAPRARQDYKPCMGNELRLMSLLTRARGAHVSRAARRSKFRLSRPACRALSPFRGVGGATPPTMQNIGCHTMSQARATGRNS